MSVRQAQTVIGQDEFDHWVAYSILEPFGEDRADWRIAQLCCILYNAYKKKGARRARLKDYMHSSEGSNKAQTPKAMWNLAVAVTRAAGKRGKIIRPEKK